VYGGARLRWNWTPLLGMQLAGGYSPTKFARPRSGDVTFWHAAGELTATPFRSDRLDLYGLVGGGYTSTKPDGGTEAVAGSFDQGVGAHLWLSDNIALNLEGRNILLIADKNHLGDSRDNNLVAGVGLTFGFGGKPRDTDADGVPDRKDKCPDTPQGATVDKDGCPHDGDGDGVFDGLDKCPGTPKGATVDAAGCPLDSDGDGVFDGLDKCPDTPKGATVDATGCPLDSDGDGVFDGLDKCPGTPKGATVDAAGCPLDSDGDGVFDGLDQCPGTAVGLKVDAAGCPIEVTEKETELLDTGMIRLQDVNFETAKADVLPDSYATLDVVGQVLSKWPELKIEVGGHTDARGSEKYNQTLSDARAAAVVAYLTRKFPGLKADQFTAKGYGESRPLAKNDSPLNMAKNRRVEFVVLNKDVLKREVERRKLLQKEGK
jgi:OOP family OmpA-OmpF porin